MYHSAATIRFLSSLRDSCAWSSDQIVFVTRPYSLKEIYSSSFQHHTAPDVPATKNMNTSSDPATATADRAESHIDNPPFRNERTMNDQQQPHDGSLAQTAAPSTLHPEQNPPSHARLAAPNTVPMQHAPSPVSIPAPTTLHQQKHMLVCPLQPPHQLQFQHFQSNRMTSLRHLR